MKLKKIFICILTLSGFYIHSQEAAKTKLELNRVVNIDGGFAYEKENELYIIETLYSLYDNGYPEIVGYSKSSVDFKDETDKSQKRVPLFGKNKIIINRGALAFPEGKKLMSRELHMMDLVLKYTMKNEYRKKKNHNGIIKTYSLKDGSVLELSETNNDYIYTTYVKTVNSEGKTLDIKEFDGLTSCAGMRGNTFYIGIYSWGNLGVFSELYIYEILP